jgi:hypothetical protein
MGVDGQVSLGHRTGAIVFFPYFWALLPKLHGDFA